MSGAGVRVNAFKMHVDVKHIFECWGGVFSVMSHLFFFSFFLQMFNNNPQHVYFQNIDDCPSFAAVPKTKILQNCHVNKTCIAAVVSAYIFYEYD